MNALIVYAHLEPRSMNGALKDVAQRTLLSLGWNVEISDLYAQNFSAAASRDDFSQLSGDEHFGYAHEQRYAAVGRRFAPDIRAEQDKILRSDLVLFQFPLWWYSVPSIIKGWAERTLTHGFAYDDDHLWDAGLLRGKQAMLSFTTGASEEELLADSCYTGSPQEFMRPFSGGVLQFVGFDVLPPFVAYAPASLDHAGRSSQLESFKAHLMREVGESATAMNATGNTSLVVA
ncbi:NAD(P)H-dependent oxidoreductase [Paraburkholderia sp. 22B1P]|uniref:NAD(P)H-dependent oxidoreductase n=1 Tax=Paraburkholderia sp. 22B1P TaxID=3080498 RepID=UPI00308D1B26|nr:NAD(P)H-dependent oxidoreductase [Paraburkholderia sp. 22B1P]